MGVDFVGEVEEDGFHEPTCGDLVLLGESCGSEDSEEVVEEHIFVLLILGYDICPE